MTSLWDDLGGKVLHGQISRIELADLIEFLRGFDRANNGIVLDTLKQELSRTKYNFIDFDTFEQELYEGKLCREAVVYFIGELHSFDHRNEDILMISFSKDKKYWHKHHTFRCMMGTFKDGRWAYSKEFQIRRQTRLRSKVRAEATITKYDMNHVIESIQCPAHYSMVFREIIEVYDPEIPYSLDQMLEPFIQKKPKFKIPAKGLMKNPADIRYSDYIVPLFLASYVMQGVTYRNVIKHVLGRILIDNGHLGGGKKIKPFFEDEWGNDFAWQYWGYNVLTEKEQKLSDELFADYLSIKKQESEVND